MKNKIIEILKQPLIYVLFICILFQIKIYSMSDEYMISPDTKGYITAANEIDLLKGKIVDGRTPVYPYFIKLIRKIGGEENLYKNIVIVQKCLYILALILLYYTLKMITKNKLLICIPTLIMGITPFIVLWNINILTETISIIEMILLSFITIKYLKNHNAILAGSMGILILIMIMTRPAYIYLLPIYILFWILKFFLDKEERKNVIIGISSCAIAGIFVIVYCSMMKYQYGKFQLTYISDANNMVSIMESKAYLDSSNNDMKQDIEKIKKEVGRSVFRVYKELKNDYTTKDVDEFINSSLKTKTHFKYLIRKSINLMPKSMEANQAPINGINKYLDKISLPLTFGMIYILTAISMVYLIWNLIRNQKINWLLAFFTALIFANLFTLIVGAPYEEQRLFVSSIVIVLLLITYILDSIVKRININS